MKNLTFLQRDDIENYEEVDSALYALGFSFLYNYNNIPFYSKYTICKSIGDLISFYKIRCLLRQNKIPYQQKECIEVDDELKKIDNYQHYSYKYCNRELKRLKKLYYDTKDPIYITQQNEIALKKAQVDYLRANHMFIHTKQYHMLPQSAIIYQNMMLKLAKSGDTVNLTSDNQLSTSSIILCIQVCIRVVRNGYGSVIWNRKYQLLNTTGRMLEWINGNLRPNINYKQVGLNRQLPTDHQWATPADFCNYIDSYYKKLSLITGDCYPKCRFTVSSYGDIQFKVPSLILTFY